LKVSTHSRPSAVAGASAGVLRHQPSVEVQAIGAGATNQAVKAIAIARSYLEDDELDVWCVPALLEVMIDGEGRTALRLLIQRRAR
jgi:stage V sporulation protein S